MKSRKGKESFVWKGHSALNFTADEVGDYGPGYVPSMVVQLQPPAACTALALNVDWNLICVRTAHGTAIVDTLLKKSIMTKCTLNANGNSIFS